MPGGRAAGSQVVQSGSQRKARGVSCNRERGNIGQHFRAGRGAKLIGNGGDDILIGGNLSFSGNLLGLAAIQKEWLSNNSYATRVGHLNGSIAGGKNGPYVLTSSTVTLGAAVSTLKGGGGRDWFWATSVAITDRFANEKLN